MIGWIQNRLRKDEGFTLVELMVVVLVIAILIAIAIPTFLGARERAQDRAAQSNLRNALTAAKVYYVDNEHYNGSAGDFDDIEPSLDFDVIANADADVVGFLVEDVVTANDDNNRITFATLSASGEWFCISDTAQSSSSITSGTYYLSGATLAAVNTATLCSAGSW